MGEIADGGDAGHAGAALEGVQVPLQGGQAVGFAVLPGGQVFAGREQQVFRFFQEQQHQLRVQGRVVAAAGAVRGGRHAAAGAVRAGGFSQVAQAVHQTQFRAHGLAGGQTVHHVHQGFVALARQFQQGFAERQAALVDAGIDAGQRLGQAVDFIQVGGAGAVGEQLQFVAQARQLLGVARLFGPLFQQVVGVDDQVHAFGQEHRKNMRVGAVAVLVERFAGLHQAFDQGGGVAGQFRQGAVVQPGQAGVQQPVGLVDHFHGVGVGTAPAVDQLLDQLLRRFRQLRHGVDLGHAGAALQGVQGAVHLVVQGVLGEVRVDLVQPLAHQSEVARRLAAEDIQQHRVDRVAGGFGLLGDLEIQGIQVRQRVVVQGRRRVGGLFGLRPGVGLRLPGRVRAVNARHRVQVLAVGERERGFLQRRHVVGHRPAVGEGVHQIRDQAVHGAHQLDQGGVGLDGAVDHPVHHVLDRPGQLPDGGGAHHAAGAFEGVEGAAEFHQRGFVAGVGRPAREILIQGLEHFFGFLDEDLDDFVVDQLFVVFLDAALVGRLRRRRFVGRRFERVIVLGGVLGEQHRRFVQWRIQRLIKRLIKRFIQRIGRRVLDVVRLIGVIRLFGFRLVDGLRQRVAQVADAGPRQAEDVIAGFRVVAETLQVVLHRGDGVGQGVHAAPVRLGLLRHQLLLDKAHALAKNVRRAVELNHLQPAAHRVETVGYRFQVLVVPVRGDEFDDAVLGLFQAGAAFAQHRV